MKTVAEALGIIEELHAVFQKHFPIAELWELHERRENRERNGTEPTMDETGDDYLAQVFNLLDAANEELETLLHRPE